MRGRWTIPDPRNFPLYQRFREQVVIIKIPDVPAPGYITQVAAVLASTLHALQTTGTKGTR
jgi:hypothetical protein